MVSGPWVSFLLFQGFHIIDVRWIVFSILPFVEKKFFFLESMNSLTLNKIQGT